MQTAPAYEDERAVRIKKIHALQKKGVLPYRGSFNKTHFTNEINVYKDTHQQRDADEVLTAPTSVIRTAGRVVALRRHGKLTFIDVRDMRGTAQVCVKEDIVGEEMYSLVSSFIDGGDFIGVEGEPFTTKQDTEALCALSVSLLSKALLPFPSEHFGIEDTELRYRKRYLDTVLNDSSKRRFAARSSIVQSFRHFLLERGFIELTTRTLQPLYGGAHAAPFTTHHNHLDTDFYLRISNELDLKMAVGGGFERAFEFAIDFRNEGIDSDHLQEFQQLEWYCAYEDFNTGIEWAEEMISRAVKDAVGTTDIHLHVKKNGEEEIVSVSLVPPFKRLSFIELLKTHDIDPYAPRETHIEILSSLDKVHYSKEELKKYSRPTLIDLLYKKMVRPHILEPTVITEYPSELFPLARKNEKNEIIADAYQILMGGTEIVKGYSELIDPIAQREALTEQERARNGGDEDAMILNEEFLTAMEHGFPPMTGCGIGIDRLTALVTGAQNLKDVVLFPLLASREDKTP